MKNITVSRDKVELWLENLEYSDSDKSVIADIKQALAAPVQDLPFGVGGGLVAIKTLLSRDPCVHANTAIEMIDAILKEHPSAQRQWVGLTVNERGKVYADWRWSDGRTSNLALCEAIEAKLKEKNNGGS